MGFFSSRKPDDDYIPDDKTTVVQVIRSRFYGKQKGKEREDRPNTTFVSQDASTAQTLSHPTVSPIRHAASVPLLSSGKIKHQSDDSNHRTIGRRLKSSVRKNFLASEASSSSMALPDLPPSQLHEIDPPGQPQHTQEPTKLSTASPRKQTDSATMTLAQRLNELAVANAEGLLNDDEYRMLRQNLFERFASSATVPSETPVVPARRHFRGPSEGASVSSRPSSNFIVDLPRTPSVRSKASVRSGVASLFHRATGRRTASGSRDYTDTSSVFSATSTTSTKPQLQPLRKKSSSSSVHTEASRPADTMSITSRQTGQTSDRSPLDFNSSRPHTPVRPSNASFRHMGPPPSSFPRTPVSERYIPSVRDVFDETNLTTSKDIKQEMAAVEAEKKRLMDAFNGLEVTTLAKRQRRPNTTNSRPATIVVDSGEHLRATTDGARPGSTITLVPRANNLQPDSDVLSIHSGFSVSTNPSVHRSYSKNLGSKNSGSLVSSNSRGSLSRKGSFSSVSSAGRAAVAKSKHVPPVPALPSYMGQLGHASSSSVNLARSTSHLPMATLPENEISFISMVDEQGEDELGFDAEMDDIRRRREEVSQRYEARLDYLRAKLKGAQLHEKLMRK
ncbi:hypothetical protein Moror_15745 [Moniliophthora roreri MCA 2997]|uniref:Uncharacterized protein n=2 Tax=Moniliophthora roreri TaxID=221103 RepID=V2WTU8_MONRO|nr:hypothetical protein Moror_15745 [Moniliophthora roreri MCA 2997]KAI3603088.1 hypothetical protein WG66_014955 [Moniliophthora roreri]